MRCPCQFVGNLDGFAHTLPLPVYSDRKSRSFDREELRALSSTLATHWPPYRDNAPTNYMREQIWAHSTPAMVSLKIGQDSKICNDDADKFEEECAAWHTRFDYTKIRYLSLSLASHFSYVYPSSTDAWLTLVCSLRFSVAPDETHWTRRPDASILKYGPFYVSPDRTIAPDPIPDLRSHPLRDSAGRVNEIFDEDGNRVNRRVPKHNAKKLRCGVLFDLAAVHRMFSVGEPLPAGIHGDVHARDEYVPVTHFVYPHAHTKSVGQWQAHGVPPTLHHSIRLVNEDIQSGHPLPVEPAERRAVWAVSAQAYNSSAHRYRHQGAQHHDVQKGRITALASGTHAVSPKAVKTFDNIRASLRNGLPHERFQAKMSPVVPSHHPTSAAGSVEADIEMDARQEVTYVIDFNRIPEQKRNGRYV